MIVGLLRSPEEALGSLRVLLAYLSRCEQHIRDTAKGGQTNTSCLELSGTNISTSNDRVIPSGSKDTTPPAVAIAATQPATCDL